MTYDWQTNLRPNGTLSAAILPPATIEATAWDILLALHRDRYCELGLAKLACLVSVPQPVLIEWLGLLEARMLITGADVGPNHELGAVLTAAGRELLDRYLSATASLQISAHH